MRQIEHDPGPPANCADSEILGALASFFTPLAPEEYERQMQSYGGAGQLTRETIMRMLLGEFS